ncbi:MAG: tRNA (guanosine(37)-N1)-methyltransferase TrmD [Deltaproteobacteria bacterium]|nr:tRNA (guanosine(37)-N1)-methyltransferase TrmD [Deltaproteobacteria bacterium]
MIFDILTLFPEACRAYLEASILGRAQKAGLVTVRLTNIRDFARDKHHTVDDTPYGGGSGMVMRPDPLCEAVEGLPPLPPGRVILLSPQGRPFSHARAAELAQRPRLILVCGRYEGVDERFITLKVDEEISLGDFVLSGGELAALAVVDAVSRLLPGVLGAADAADNDSFAAGLLEHPHYTRPAVYRGLAVPEVLQSGNHAAIARFRREESLRRTWRRRPELLERLALDKNDRAFLACLSKDREGEPA